jgi:hypothetical protein
MIRMETPMAVIGGVALIVMGAFIGTASKTHAHSNFESGGWVVERVDSLNVGWQHGHWEDVVFSIEGTPYFGMPVNDSVTIDRKYVIDPHHWITGPLTGEPPLFVREAICSVCLRHVYLRAESTEPEWNRLLGQLKRP